MTVVGSGMWTYLLRPPASPLRLLLGHKWAIMMEPSWPTRWGGTDEALTSELRTLGYLVSDGRREVRPRPVGGGGRGGRFQGGPGVAPEPRSSLWGWASPDAITLDPISHMHPL